MSKDFSDYEISCMTEDGEELNLVVIDSIEYADSTFLVLAVADSEEDDDGKHEVMFAELVDEDNDEYSFEPVTDDELISELLEVFEDKMNGIHFQCQSPDGEVREYRVEDVVIIDGRKFVIASNDEEDYGEEDEDLDNADSDVDDEPDDEDSESEEIEDEDSELDDSEDEESTVELFVFEVLDFEYDDDDPELEKDWEQVTDEDTVFMVLSESGFDFE